MDRTAVEGRREAEIAEHAARSTIGKQSDVTFDLLSPTAAPATPSMKKLSDLYESHRSFWSWLGGSGPLDPPGQRRAWLHCIYSI